MDQRGVSTIVSGLRNVTLNLNSENSQLVEKNCEGRWTEAEHALFREGVLKFGKEWNSVARHVQSRTSAQTRSHAQKFIRKLKKYGCTDGEEQELLIILNAKA